MIEPRRLKGFRDYLPDLMSKRLFVIGNLRDVARQHGFLEIQTPALEYADVLLGQGSEETDKQTYVFTDHGDRRVGLRFDLTIPLARYCAEHLNDLVLPFKRLQIGEVWRGENTQKGRYREFSQCDLDIVGVDSVLADIDVILCLQKVLTRLNFGEWTMKIGHRGILSTLLQKCLKISAEQEGKTLIIIDKLDKIGVEKVQALLKEQCQVEAEDSKNFLSLIQKSFSLENFDELQALLQPHLQDQADLLRLKEVLKAVGKNTIVDLSIARGLGYYTGIVFETIVNQAPSFGSICSGGRYNRLVERFVNRSLACVGGSLGLDRLIAVIEELKIPFGIDTTPHAFIAIATEDAQAAALELAEDMRLQSLNVETSMQIGKLGNQFKYADKRQIPYVIVIGTDEVQSNTFTMKNMKTGEEQKQLTKSNLLSQVSKGTAHFRKMILKPLI